MSKWRRGFRRRCRSPRSRWSSAVYSREPPVRGRRRHSAVRVADKSTGSGQAPASRSQVPGSDPTPTAEVSSVAGGSDAPHPAIAMASAAIDADAATLVIPPRTASTVFIFSQSWHGTVLLVESGMATEA